MSRRIAIESAGSGRVVTFWGIWGYSTRESRIFDPYSGLVWVIDASKGDERWVVHVENRTLAAVDLMVILGRDLKG